MMGYEYLALDQDKVAMKIAQERGMDWATMSSTSLPVVDGEVAGNFFLTSLTLGANFSLSAYVVLRRATLLACCNTTLTACMLAVLCLHVPSAGADTFEEDASAQLEETAPATAEGAGTPSFGRHGGRPGESGARGGVGAGSGAKEDGGAGSGAKGGAVGAAAIGAFAGAGRVGAFAAGGLVYVPDMASTEGPGKGPPGIAG